MIKPPQTRGLSEREALGQAIKKLRRQVDLTQDQAAEALGVKAGSWRRYEWGERGLDLERLQRIAEALGVSREQILSEAERLRGGSAAVAGGPPGPAAAGKVVAFPRRMVEPELAWLPVRDPVQAGAFLSIDDLGQVEPERQPAARDPRFPHADQWLAPVVGDSVNALGVFDGDLAHCVDAVEIGYAPRTGDLVEVERLRFGGQLRELTLKQVEVGPDGVRLWPRSTNPRWREPIELVDDAGDEGAVVRIRGLVVAAIRRF